MINQTFTLDQIKDCWKTWNEKMVLVGNVNGKEMLVDPAKTANPTLFVRNLKATNPRWKKYKDTKTAKNFPDFLVKWHER